MKKYKYCPMCKTSLAKALLEGHTRLVCKKCHWIDYKNPIPVIACFVTSRKKELLLIKRNVTPCVGRWALPGGFIELSETLEKAGRRELREETGLKGKPGRLVGIHAQKSRQYGFVLVIGMEFIVTNENITVGDDAQDANFFSLKTLPPVPFKSHRKLIEEFLQL